MQRIDMKKRILALIMVTLFLNLTACNNSNGKTSSVYEISLSSDYDNSNEKSLSFFAMDTYMNFKAYGENAKTAVNEASALVEDLENKLSVTNPESEISKINSSANNAIKISEDTLALISTALDVNKKSGGAFDITIYPIVKLWGFTTGKYEVPNKEEILKNLEYVDSSNIKLDEKEGTVTVPENIEIDLGGIAKGYAGKKAAEKIRSMGIESALLNLGGNIQTIGSKPDGSAWGVSICNPEDSSKQLCRIEVVDKAVVTSGGYQRYFEENGKSYHHIIDPKSGYPAENGLLSVTIVDEDGMLCDALSTTLFVLGKDKALEYCEKYGIEAILMTDDKKIYVTDGLKESFSIIDQTSGYFLAE